MNFNFLAPFPSVYVSLGPCWLLRARREHKSQPVKCLVLQLNSISIVLSRIDFLEWAILQTLDVGHTCPGYSIKLMGSSIAGGKERVPGSIVNNTWWELEHKWCSVHSSHGMPCCVLLLTRNRLLLVSSVLCCIAFPTGCSHSRFPITNKLKWYYYFFLFCWCFSLLKGTHSSSTWWDINEMTVCHDLVRLDSISSLEIRKTYFSTLTYYCFLRLVSWTLVCFPGLWCSISYSQVCHLCLSFSSGSRRYYSKALWLQFHRIM